MSVRTFVVALAAIALVGCGDDGGDTSTESDGGAGTVTATAGSTTAGSGATAGNTASAGAIFPQPLVVSQW